MSSHEQTALAGEEAFPEELTEVGVYRTAAEGFERGLVVLAMGEAYWLLPTASGFALQVASSAAPEVRRQLEKFERECVGWPPKPLIDAARENRFLFFTPLLWSLAVLASYWAQARWPAWTALGTLDATAVLGRGEIWRLATALFLHADGAHLISNALSGIFVFSAVLSVFGRIRGWAWLAIASMGGNLAAVAFHRFADYRSLGASTAVFAGLGLLTGRAARIVWRASGAERWRALFVPLATGLTVLGLFGAGGQNIDVLAHLTGFVVGVMTGWGASADRRRA